MIFKSHQVNLDPEPLERSWNGERAATYSGFINGTGGYRYNPRSEFEPTRDPFPYTREDGSGRYAFPGKFDGKPLVFHPRREQFDTPVNRILVAFRKDRIEYYPAIPMKHLIDEWLYIIDCLPLNGYSIAVGTFTEEEAEHARKVLTRLKEWE